MVDAIRPGFSPFRPDDLLYRKVLFSAYAGQPMTFRPNEDHPEWEVPSKDFMRSEKTPILLMS